MKNNVIAGFLLSGMFLALGCENNTTIKTSIKKETVHQALDTALYLNKGQEIAQSTFKVLSKNLQQAMGNGGVPKAINFCSMNAQSLTDSLGSYQNVSIKRTSHKIRNPLNAPTEQESAAIDHFLTGNKQAFIEENKDGSISFYAPIYTKGMCLACHGEKGSSMLESDFKLILNKYPEDKAIDFSLNELRGIWSLILNPKNNE